MDSKVMTMRLHGLVVGAFTLVGTVYAQDALAGAAPPAAEVATITDPFTAFVAFIRGAGPVGLAVLAGYWAVKKDREKNEAATAYQAQLKAMYDQVVGLVAAQTAATAKMEGTILALKDAILALRNGNGNHEG